MGDFFRAILDSIQFLWVFRIVQQWEQGGYYVCGRFWRVVGPGCYPILPWFTEVRAESMATAIVKTPKNDMTLKDNTTLHYCASAKVRIVDFNLAVNTVEQVHSTAQEQIESTLAEKLAEIEPSRLRPEGRKRLLSDLRRWVDEDTQVFGVEVQSLSFNTFVLNARTYRLLGNTQDVQSW